MTRDEERIALACEPLIDRALELWENELRNLDYSDSKRIDAIHQAVHQLAMLHPEYEATESHSAAIAECLELSRCCRPNTEEIDGAFASCGETLSRMAR